MGLSFWKPVQLGELTLAGVAGITVDGVRLGGSAKFSFAAFQGTFDVQKTTKDVKKRQNGRCATA